MSLPEAVRVNPDAAICDFFLARKNRFCRTEKAPNESFCPTHLTETADSARKRIPCPINPNHTIYAEDAKRHVLVCPDRRFDTTTLPYFSRGLHAFRGVSSNAAAAEGRKTTEVCEDASENHNAHQVVARATHRDLDASSLSALITKIESFYDSHVKQHLVARHIEDDDAKRILVGGAVESSLLSQKHSPQHVSLVSLICKGWPQDCVDSPVVVMEMGAGKGGLALALHQTLTKKVPALPAALTNSELSRHISFFVVDVGGFRRKKDGCVKDEAMPFSRLRINIKDLDLRQVDELKSLCTSQSSTVQLLGVGKHLCGACTDFALSCLTNDMPSFLQTATITIATCCHHLCELDHMNQVSWKSDNCLEADQGVPHPIAGSDKGVFLGCFSSREFAAIVSMTSWAVSGSAVDDERRLVGRHCKRILDFARMMYLREVGFSSVELAEYVPESVSPENVCIVARR